MAETSRAVYTVAPLLSCYVCICIHQAGFQEANLPRPTHAAREGLHSCCMPRAAKRGWLTGLRAGVPARLSAGAVDGHLLSHGAVGSTARKDAGSLCNCRASCIACKLSRAYQIVGVGHVQAERRRARSGAHVILLKCFYTQIVCVFVSFMDTERKRCSDNQLN